jgi:hypothetical protein
MQNSRVARLNNCLYPKAKIKSMWSVTSTIKYVLMAQWWVTKTHVTLSVSHKSSRPEYSIVNRLFLGLWPSSLMWIKYRMWNIKNIYKSKIHYVSITGPVIETSSINRTQLSRPEDGRRAIFRNVVNFRFLYILYYIHNKDDAQSPTNKWFTMLYTIVKSF